MTRKVKWLAVGAVAAVAVGITPFISFAGDEPATPASAAEASDGQVSSEMADAMKRDLDLTDAQLATRLDTEASAPDIQENLEDKLGSSFGGAWIPQSGDRLKVAITDPADAATVIAAGADPDRAGGHGHRRGRRPGDRRPQRGRPAEGQGRAQQERRRGR